VYRTQLADIIFSRLNSDEEILRAAWLGSAPINYVVIDDVFPTELANSVRSAFPQGASMKIKRSLRELKFIAAQMDKYDSVLEETIYAFQDPRIVNFIGRFTGLQALEPDEELYAGGISMMVKGHFLNPHVDNSHDKARERYRVLNLLYYASPEWKMENGGNLELWPEGPTGSPVTIESKFNRLVVMLTNRSSWHSVSPVSAEQARCCVSNYYFSKYSPEQEAYFHVTSFRGRPEQRVRDLLLRADIAVRTGIRRLFPKGVVENKHFYKKE
jgi:Rps23 Pro-64 3,4-dihydroxylase Tpa1-like proline 4-hydroxylase